MAATDAPATLSEMRTAFLNLLKEVTGTTGINTVVDRMLNIALQDMHQERWYWSERRSTIRSSPPYTTGTIAVAVTSLTTRRTVTGTGTAWNTANSFGDVNAIGAGAKMTLGSTSVVHELSAIGSDTSLTLTTATPYTGDSALSGESYAIYQDEYALASDFGEPTDLRFFDEDRRIRLVGAQAFYAAYAKNTQRSGPEVATLIELGPSGSVALRPRVVLGPAPDKTYIIPYRYQTTSLAVSSAGVAAVNLTADADQPIVPLGYRMGVVYQALALWFATRQKNAALAADFAGRYTGLMLRARQRTDESRDKPQLRPAVGAYWRAARRPWRGGRRYDGNAAFDSMRF